MAEAMRLLCSVQDTVLETGRRGLEFVHADKGWAPAAPDQQGRRTVFKGGLFQTFLEGARMAVTPDQHPWRAFRPDRADLDPGKRPVTRGVTARPVLVEPSGRKDHGMQGAVKAFVDDPVLQMIAAPMARAAVEADRITSQKLRRGQLIFPDGILHQMQGQPCKQHGNNNQHHRQLCPNLGIEIVSGQHRNRPVPQIQRIEKCAEKQKWPAAEHPVDQVLMLPVCDHHDRTYDRQQGPGARETVAFLNDDDCPEQEAGQSSSAKHGPAS